MASNNVIFSSTGHLT
jgi:hypothetical protein